MSPRHLVLLLLPCLALCTAPRAAAQFRVLETPDLRLVSYTAAHDYLVDHLARCFENALRFHRRTFDYTPSEKITLILEDFGDMASGGANTRPFNLMGIGIAPFDYSYETMPPVERMSMMMNHELAHIATMDKPSPSNRLFRTLFGGKVTPVAEAPESMLWAYLTSPRWNSPRWFIEGIAVFMETWMNGGLGRALGAYDEMMFRTMVRDGADLYDVVGLEAEAGKVDFQVGASAYLYGTRFVSWLALTRTPDRLLAWMRQTDSSRNHFAAQFRHVYGESISSAWRSWQAWERDWQRRNLDSVRANPITPLRSVTDRALGSVSRAYVDPRRRTLYAAVNAPGQTAHLAAIDLASGAHRRLAHIRGGTLYSVASLAHDPDAGVLFYTTDNNQWRDLACLDLATGRTRTLLTDARVGDLAFNRADRSLWGVRHFNGISTLVRIPAPYTEWKTVHAFPYGEDLYDIDISPDGRFLSAALGDVTSRQRLVEMKVEDLLRGTAAPEELYDFDVSAPANFAYGPDGKHLYGSTYYSGVSNIVRYDRAVRTMEWLSNAESGLFRPVPLGGDSLVAFHFTAKGFQPVMLAERPVENVNAIRYLGQEIVTQYPALREWTLPPPSPARIPLDSLVTYRGEYAPLANVALASVHPVVQGYKEFAAFGLRATFGDPVLFHRLDVTASYTPNAVLPADERLHAALQYRYVNWSFSASWNAADFYDLAGPVKTGRRGAALRIGYADHLLYDEPEILRWSAEAAGYWRLDRLPDYQNIVARYDHFYTVRAALDYTAYERSLGAVEPELGFAWNLSLPTSIIGTRVHPLAAAQAAAGKLLPIDHSSLWLRVAAGKGFGAWDDPHARFYFGGFGNNWLDHREIWRYRELASLPGRALNEAGGNTFAKATVEWTLPPVHFRSFGLPALYCNWARVALFATTLGTDVDRAAARRVHASTGLQLDFRLVALSSLETTLSLGAAAAYERGRRPATEFMVSLKIL